MGIDDAPHESPTHFSPRIAVTQEYRTLVTEIEELDREIEKMIIPNDVEEKYLCKIHASEIFRLSSGQLSESEIQRTIQSQTSGNSNAVRRIVNRYAIFLCLDRFAFPYSVGNVEKINRIMCEGSEITLTGSEDVIETVSANAETTDDPEDDTVSKLNALLDWVNSSPYDAITTASVFIDEFNALRSFLSNNDEICKIMFLSVLRSFGLRNTSFCRVLEFVMCDEYLTSSSDRNDSSYFPLMMSIAEKIKKSYISALEELRSKDVREKLDCMSIKIISIGQKVSSFNVSDAASWTGLSEQSVRDKMNAMVAMDVIERSGSTKGTRYYIGDALEQSKYRAERKPISEGYLDSL